QVAERLIDAIEVLLIRERDKVAVGESLRLVGFEWLGLGAGDGKDRSQRDSRREQRNRKRFGVHGAFLLHPRVPYSLSAVSGRIGRTQQVRRTPASGCTNSGARRMRGEMPFILKTSRLQCSRDGARREGDAAGR